MFNAGFWAVYFRRVFPKQIIHFCAAVETRFLPTFNSIETEAEEASETEWERLGQVVDPEYADESDMAERAHETGIEYYMAMEGLRQSLINLSTASLYHLFEQQLLLFHRREVLHSAEQDNKKLINTVQFKARLSAAGIEIDSLSSWPQIEELRFVANAIKHAEGPSADKVRELRPDLFRHPMLRQSPIFRSSPMFHIYMPMAGEDIYITVSDLKQYGDALLRFWKEFLLIIQ